MSCKYFEKKFENMKLKKQSKISPFSLITFLFLSRFYPWKAIQSHKGMEITRQEEQEESRKTGKLIQENVMTFDSFQP